MGTTPNTTTANQPSTNTTTLPGESSTTPAATSTSPARPALWIEDEKRVRAGNCSFQVKYLGFQEVSDSRGMQICETAIEKLLALDRDKKKPIKAILYVSGDSLRVVDESNKTLLVDQTIEKVSFCAPDRHHESGFAYICRDGTARRWLCHGFLAIKETLKGATAGSTGGERLSHAVGCAFSVCLEKKQKRERENVSMEVGPNHSFTRLGSFRQASLTERFEDPQMVMPAAEPVPIKAVDNPHAIERPKPSVDAFQRQNSLRGSALQMPFKRSTAAYTSLKPGELPSFQQQKIASGFSSNSPLASASAASTNAQTKTSLLMQQQLKQQQQQQQQPQQQLTLAELANQSQTCGSGGDMLVKSDTFSKSRHSMKGLFVGSFLYAQRFIWLFFNLIHMGNLFSVKLNRHRCLI
jgi:numb-like protein